MVFLQPVPGHPDELLIPVDETKCMLVKANGDKFQVWTCKDGHPKYPENENEILQTAAELRQGTPFIYPSSSFREQHDPVHRFQCSFASFLPSSIQERLIKPYAAIREPDDIRMRFQVFHAASDKNNRIFNQWIQNFSPKQQENFRLADQLAERACAIPLSWMTQISQSHTLLEWFNHYPDLLRQRMVHIHTKIGYESMGIPTELFNDIEKGRPDKVILAKWIHPKLSEHNHRKLSTAELKSNGKRTIGWIKKMLSYQHLPDIRETNHLFGSEIPQKDLLLQVSKFDSEFTYHDFKTGDLMHPYKAALNHVIVHEGDPNARCKGSSRLVSEASLEHFLKDDGANKFLRPLVALAKKELQEKNDDHLRRQVIIRKKSSTPDELAYLHARDIALSIPREWSHLLQAMQDADIPNTQFSPEQIVHMSRTWERGLGAKTAKERENACKMVDASDVSWMNPKLEPDVEWQVQPLETPEQLTQEGTSMQHCVGTLTSHALQGSCHFYHLQRNNQQDPATMQIIYDDNQWQLDEIQGPNNTEVSSEVMTQAQALIDRLQQRQPEGPTPEQQRQQQKARQSYDSEISPEAKQAGKQAVRKVLLDAFPKLRRTTQNKISL